MKNISILTFIRIVIVFVFIAILGLFGLFISVDQQKHQLQQQERHEIIANGFLNAFDYITSEDQWKDLYEKFEVKPIEDREFKLEILNDAKTVYQKESPTTRIRIFNQNLNHYIYVQQAGNNLMLKDMQHKVYDAIMTLVLFFFIAISLIFLYMMLVKKLQPLKQLHKKIKEFSGGNLDVNITNYGDDEVGEISKSFNQAIVNINHLIESKNLFMRNMMHELKTPITKGLLITEMIECENGDDKELLKKLFNEMNALISMLAKLEKISMANQSLIKQKVNLGTMIKDVQRQLDTAKDTVKISGENLNLVVNQELFTIVLKNLVDNAIKYSKNSPIIIECNSKKISIASQGDKLQYGLDYYLQPFSQEKKNNQGFGLGLYIVSEIISLHQFKFKYKYSNRYNIFTIDFNQK